MFKAFSKSVNDRLTTFANAKFELFKVDTLDLFESYLAAFPAGTNPMFRERTEHDCNCCKNFIRNLGNVVALDGDGRIQTVWDNWSDLPEPYATVGMHLQQIVMQAPVVSVYRTKELFYGSKSNRDNHDPSIVWDHFHGEPPVRVRSKTPDKDRGAFNTKVQVLRRGLDEIRAEDIETVLDLIEQKSIYRGEEHLKAIKDFRDLQNGYKASKNPANFPWAHAGHPAAGFRNTVIGTLLVDLANGDDIEAAVKKFEAKVAPSNYKRPKALVTPKMIEQAVAQLRELELDEAIERRFARIEDVSVNDVLFVDNAARSKMKDSLTDMLMASEKVKPRKVSDKATPIKIEDFLKLGATSIELVLSNQQLGNFCSLTAPAHADTGRLFKWGNDFAWSYDGEVADSMRERVAEAGGRVDGPFRFTHSWNHEGRRNASLMDLHVLFPGCAKPKGRQHNLSTSSRRVGWNRRNDPATGARQDVDYTNAAPAGYIPIENIAFPDITKMPEGVYECYVHNWNRRSPNEGGFKAQIEVNGVVYDYDYPPAVGLNEWVHVASVTLKNGQFTVEHHIASSTTPRDKWGVKTLTPVKVNTIMLSPNHWDGAGGVGNRHWLFMLDGCSNPNPTRGIYNEFLRGELEPHRKVFEILGSKMKCQPTPDQLSGVGFSSTRGDKVTAIADGRTYEVEF